MKVAGVIILVLLLTGILIQFNNKSSQNNAPSILNISNTAPTAQQSDKNLPKTKKGDSKPFWTDNEVVQVCKVPYYTSEGCTDLDVTLTNDNTAQIHFSNGENKVTNNLTCFTGNGGQQEPKYVFCRSWDSSNQQWDFFPTWVRL